MSTFSTRDIAAAIRAMDDGTPEDLAIDPNDLLAHPKPRKRVKQPKPLKRGGRPKQFRDTERAKWIRRCDSECAFAVKFRAALKCECGCYGLPSEGNPLDWSHGDGRAQVWELRWAHSNTFALLRDCDRRLHRTPETWEAYRRSMVVPTVWAQVQELERTRDKNKHTSIERLKEIYAGLKRGVFVQGGRDAA